MDMQHIMATTPSPAPLETISTFISSIGMAKSPHFDYNILEQVSNMTLEEPQSPKTPMQTPLVRKRKPSFVVTPPRCHADVLRLDARLFETTNGNQKSRGNPPMLPDSPELNAVSNHNPFTRHRPMHSPLARTSHVNPDFVSIFQETEANESSMPCLALSARNLAAPLAAIGNFLPNLDDETRPMRALKMRRGCREDFDVPEVEML